MRETGTGLDIMLQRAVIAQHEPQLLRTQRNRRDDMNAQHDKYETEPTIEQKHGGTLPE
jgi:hypothetical protein